MGQLNLLKNLNIGDLSPKLPLIQGGMGVGISLSGLASAVANEGGIGVIATAGIGMTEPDFGTDFLAANIRALQKELRKARELTKGILGVNIMTALSNFSDMARTSIEEGVDVIFSGAGLPLNLPQFLGKNSKTKLVPIVSSARAAGIIFKKWTEKYNYVPDAVVVEGPLAGGHLGFKKDQIADPEYSLENLVPQVVTEVSGYEEKHRRIIPVIAAGGVYSGDDIQRLMGLGATGVQMATRFITTNECDASLEFKKTFLGIKQEDLVIIKSPVGLLGRAIQNNFIADVALGKKKPFRCPYHCITTCDYQNSPYCICLALINACQGKLNNGFAFSGANAYRATEIVSVRTLIGSLFKDFGPTHGTIV